uniref:Uncharacterized protein n=2 Tax=Hemiselmis andersenii TaxID=464988 RepID=A0A6T8N5B6_HEMAN|mmetsp:Transcript_42445/g.98774  ORF Transcript_42445/g.98774 Transcript_42445/m.98774 type:complete len:142 (-) Transcript_42445:244-669(-)
MARSTLSLALLVIFALVCVPQAESFRSMRGGGDAPSQSQQDAETYMKEQMDYWNGLSKEQQETLLSTMSPEEREATLAFVSGKPTMTISDASLQAWKAMSPAEQQAQLAQMTPEQQQAIKAAVSGQRQTVDTSKVEDMRLK